MEIERAARVATRLLESTRSGKITWTEDNSNTYVTTVANHVIYVAEHDDETGNPYTDPDYSMGIRQKFNDKWVDSFSDEEMSSVMDGAYKMLQALYREARHRARGVDQILDDVLKALEGD